MNATGLPQPALAANATRPVAWAAGVLVVLGLAAYANSFGVPFLFDDIPAITENPTIRRLSDLGEVLAPQRVGGLTVAGRPVVNLSLALNYAVSGYAVWSYHCSNVAVHLAAALTLFGLVRRTLLLPSQAARIGSAATPLAFTVAALWMLHPLQTESVTYLVQRAESLAGLLYLLTFYCYVRAAEAPGATRWSVAATVCCALGMATKEVVVSAPLLAVLYDRTFLGGTWREAWRARGRLWLALAATWVLLAWLVLGTGGRGGTAGIGLGISSWHYALTQCRAIVTYLGLAVWPHPLVFDYGLGVERDPVAVLPQALLLLGMLAGGLVLVWRRTPAGFLAAWFFALLAPSSSILPVVTQTMAEHRMYLPLASLVALAVLGGYGWCGRRSGLIWVVPALVLGGVTIARNTDYRSDLAIWSDTAAKLPANARAHNNLGQAQFRLGRLADAVRSYDEALRRQPRYPETHYNLAVALAARGDNAGAVDHYRTALRLEPDYIAAHNNLGNALVRTGELAGAIAQFNEALRRDPDFVQAHTNLGNALVSAGRAAEAVAHLRRAVELQPDSAEVRYNLGNGLASAGRMAEALAQFTEATRRKPDYAAAFVNTGNALLQLGRVPEAMAAYGRATELNPALAEAHFNLASALLDLARWPEAIGRLEQALRINPAWPDAHRALGFALAQAGRPAEAVVHYEIYLRAVSGDTAAADELRRLRTAVPGTRR